MSLMCIVQVGNSKIKSHIGLGLCHQTDSFMDNNWTFAFLVGLQLTILADKREANGIRVTNYLGTVLITCTHNKIDTLAESSIPITCYYGLPRHLCVLLNPIP